MGVAATDIATGLYAHGAIVAALISRQQTNKGVWIDCNLFESQMIISYSVIQKDTVNYRLHIAGLVNIASNYLESPSTTLYSLVRIFFFFSFLLYLN